MPRISFEGKGDPIPLLALPPMGGDDNMAPVTLTYTENASFPVSDYRTLGFTHFEVWAVGASGGRGGDATAEYAFVKVSELKIVAANVWDLHRERVRIQDYFVWGHWDHVYTGWDPSNPNRSGTALDRLEFQNPNHELTFVTYRYAYLVPTIQGLGGGGGGGGFHRVSGILTDLPNSVPIVVGKSGVDPGYGQVKTNGVFTPNLADDPDYYLYPNPAAESWPRSRLQELENYFTTYLNSYPLPHSAFSNPQPGGNGGASSFGEVCQASGGVGGQPGMVWDAGTSQFVHRGYGGAGGVGNRLAVGGGAAGSTADGVNGSDGVWLPESGIGSGGGGGKGGREPTLIRDPLSPSGAPRYTSTPNNASSGGQGSYSFEDTSVYGQRQSRHAWTYLKPTTSQPDGEPTWVPTQEATALVTAGGGGGARPQSNLKTGSRAPGYSPNGVVVVRLVTLT